MKIKLSPEILGSLPAPDTQGLVRVTATLSITSDGEADLSEINDMPVGDSEPDDDKPMPASDLPDLNAAERDIYQ